jgi:hypothetical protein
MKQYKIIHQLIPCFKINFKVSESIGDINESTIPIYFEKVLMYVSPDYRGRLSTRMRLLKNEFKRLIETDNFLSMCSSTAQLFDFMDHFHQQVLKADGLVRNFIKIVRDNNAIIERDPQT